MYKAKYLQPRPSSKGLVLDYNLNVSEVVSGSVHDYSGNGNTGTITDSVPVYPGFLFDGSDDIIDTGSAFQSTFRASFSVVLWCKPDDGQPAAEDTLFGATNGTQQDNVFIEITTAGKIDFTVESNNNAANALGASATFANGQGDWTSIICTAEDNVAGGAGQLLVYVDGSVLGIGAGAGGGGDASGLTFADFTSTDNIFIGGMNLGTAATIQPFAGLLSGIQIYDRVLSAQEVLSIFSLERHKYKV